MIFFLRLKQSQKVKFMYGLYKWNSLLPHLNILPHFSVLPCVHGWKCRFLGSCVCNGEDVEG